MPANPTIVVTVAVAARQADPVIAERKSALYADSVRRHGGEPVVLDATAPVAVRRDAFATMDGLLLTGGADMDPARYDASPEGAAGMEPDRDALEAEAWEAAEASGVPVLGICRGMQAMNVFSGGRLLQHVEGHLGADYGHGPAATHPLRVLPGTRLARILFPANVGGGALTVNSYHHQAIRRADLAPGFVPSALSPSRAGELVEAMEQPGDRFRMAVQCHPERQESTPAAFERLFAFFLDSCRGPAQRR
jgi:putative glutamine amidotransferase